MIPEEGRPAMTDRRPRTAVARQTACLSQLGFSAAHTTTTHVPRCLQQSPDGSETSLIQALRDLLLRHPALRSSSVDKTSM